MSVSVGLVISTMEAAKEILKVSVSCFPASHSLIQYYFEIPVITHRATHLKFKSGGKYSAYMMIMEDSHFHKVSLSHL